jgi:hypothetical protein
MNFIAHLADFPHLHPADALLPVGVAAAAAFAVARARTLTKKK